MIKDLVQCPICHHGHFYGDDCKYCLGLVKDTAEPVVAQLKDAKPKPKWLLPHEYRPKFYQTLPPLHALIAKNGHRRVLMSRIRDDYNLTQYQARYVVERWEKGATDIKDFSTENDELIVSLASALNHLYEQYGNERPAEGI